MVLTAASFSAFTAGTRMFAPIFHCSLLLGILKDGDTGTDEREEFDDFRLGIEDE